ncbi:MAG TPA: hypothetical protein DCR90_02990 [Fusobacteriaceae bacterium]|nr:hypothetical protein [Fusobacteriaceae bacterium]
MTTITLKDILTHDNLKAFFKHSFKFFSHFPKAYLHFINLHSLLRKIVENFLLLNLFFLALLVLTILLDLLLVSLNSVLLAEKFMQKNGLKNYRLN